MFPNKIVPLLLSLFQIFPLDLAYSQETNTPPALLSPSDDPHPHAVFEQLPIIRPLRRRGRGRGQTLISIGLIRRRQQEEANRTTTSLPTPQPTGDTSPTTYSAFGMTKMKLPKWTGVEESLYAGVVLPYSMFHRRDYRIAINVGMDVLEIRPAFEELFARHFKDGPVHHFPITMMTLGPSPQESLRTFCRLILHSNVSAILYLTHQENYGSYTAASKYFLQLAHDARLPVIAWNADNSGLRRDTTQSSKDDNMVLQLAPSIHHQVGAMLSILTRYNWNKFAIVTSEIAGHDEFAKAVRDRVRESQSKFEILASVKVLQEDDLMPLIGSDARIFLLYCTREESKWIMAAATRLGLTESKNYVWIVTQSVIGDKLIDLPPQDLPIGMLGVHFNTSIAALKDEIMNVVRIYLSGVLAFKTDENNSNISLAPQLSCDGAGGGVNSYWVEGKNFYEALRSVVVDSWAGRRPPMSFNPDGTLRNVELKIMNLRRMSVASEANLTWEQIGSWRSWRKSEDDDQDDNQLEINDNVWPGNISQKSLSSLAEHKHRAKEFNENGGYLIIRLIQFILSMF